MSGTGEPALPLVRPSLPPAEALEPLLSAIWRSGIVTTGPLTRAFEESVEERLGVRHAVMVDHGTTALMLAVRALGLKGEVVVPSFSWTATAGALVWNGIEPVFADVTPGRLTLDPEAAEAAITDRTSAIMPVNAFGVPPDVDAFEALGRRHGIPVLYDSAQGLGARCGERPCGGFGTAECFSLSPTKVVTALEGGLVTTNHDGPAAAVRSMRDSGKAPDGGDIVHVGMSGRPSEVHAAVASLAFDRLDTLIAERLERIGWYRELLADVPGVSFQDLPDDSASTGNYFVIFVDPERGGCTRDEIRARLAARNIQAKPYFHPAIHLQAAYTHLRSRYEGRLPVSERAAAEGLALPLFGAMTRVDVERAASAVREALTAGAAA